jgi:phosphatidylglycerophosphatase A
VAVTALAVWGSNYAEKHYKEKDPGKVVIDEIAGFFFAMFLIPTTIAWVVAAFFIFRAMDVWKPGPIRPSQNLGGGVGIVIDDVLAGILTCAILHAVRLGLSALP